MSDIYAEEFQEVLLEGEDENRELQDFGNDETRQKRSSKQNELAESDSYTSLTPVNEVQPFPFVAPSTIAKVGTPRSTSAVSTPRAETQNIPKTMAKPSKMQIVKDSPPTTMQDVQTVYESNENGGISNPKLIKQEKFCYSRFEDDDMTTSQCSEFREMRDRGSSIDSEFFPSTSASVYENKSDQDDYESCRKSSTESVSWVPPNQRKSAVESEISDCAFPQNLVSHNNCYPNKISSRHGAPPDSDCSGYTTSRSRYDGNQLSLIRYLSNMSRLYLQNNNVYHLLVFIGILCPIFNVL